jgi:hypothetical protein
MRWVCPALFNYEETRTDEATELRLASSDVNARVRLARAKRIITIPASGVMKNEIKKIVRNSIPSARPRIASAPQGIAHRRSTIPCNVKTAAHARVDDACILFF